MYHSVYKTDVSLSQLNTGVPSTRFELAPPRLADGRSVPLSYEGMGQVPAAGLEPARAGRPTSFQGWPVCRLRHAGTNEGGNGEKHYARSPLPFLPTCLKEVPSAWIIEHRRSRLMLSVRSDCRLLCHILSSLGKF